MTEKQLQQKKYYQKEVVQIMPSGRYKGLPIRLMQGKKQIEYLRKYITSPNASKRTYLRNAIHRKLNQYKSVKWDNFNTPTRKPKPPFNYWKFLYPDTYE